MAKNDVFTIELTESEAVNVRGAIRLKAHELLQKKPSDEPGVVIKRLILQELKDSEKKFDAILEDWDARAKAFNAEQARKRFLEELIDV